MGQLEDAFRTAEQLRSRNFLALLNRGLPPGRTASERQREIELRERIRRLEEALEEESDGSLQQQRDMAVEVYSRELVDAESEYQAFLDDHLVSDEIYPGLRSLDIPSVEQIVKTLPQGTAIAEFVVAEDAVVAFVLTARGLEATSVPIVRANNSSSGKSPCPS